MVRHFLDLSSAGADGVAAMLSEALDRKRARAGWPKGKVDADRPLEGRVLAMIFEKSSTRTRVSFDMAIRQLGGTSIVMDAGSMQLGRGETIADTARVLSRYVDAIMIRTDDPAKLDELAKYASVPVINGLTDRSHPCQIVADLLTAIEKGLQLPGSRWAWLGDPNNVLFSILEAAALFKFSVRVGCPQGYERSDWMMDTRAALLFDGQLGNAPVEIATYHDPVNAIAGADVVVTDTWVSMGQAHDLDKIKAMTPFQVNEQLMAHAASNATFLHCLPAHRGEEATDEILDGNQSAIWEEAENRLHAQKAILLWCFGLIDDQRN